FPLLWLFDGADPDNCSDLGLTPLHFASLSQATIDFAEKLLEARANPNGCNQHPNTPLQAAAIQDREDVVKVLMSAVALVTPISGIYPIHYIHNEAISQMIHKLRQKEINYVLKSDILWMWQSLHRGKQENKCSKLLTVTLQEQDAGRPGRYFFTYFATDLELQSQLYSKKKPLDVSTLTKCNFSF
uniref:Uncharacterized protein n=1 Tax=Sparus aurata TaxID=8175 RepID=A0A671YWB3_SPAAU